MPDEKRMDLAKYRLERAKACLADSELLLNNDSYMTAVNRAYYAIFHAARAVMAIDGEDRKKHSGVISYFQENYVKSGLFEKDYSYILQNAFEVRQESDYEDFYMISKEEAEQQISNAHLFVSRIEKHLNNIKSN